MARNFPIQRKSAQRETVKKYFFICEGHKTEQLYFHELSNFINLNSIKLITLQYQNSGYSHPKYLIQKSIEC